MNMQHFFRRFALLLFLMLPSSLTAQEAGNELAATMEVLRPGVEVLRVNTSNWIMINVEAIVGVGDRIRTNDTGQARITFFADGVDVVILPDTEYLIERFEGSSERFRIAARVLLGQTIQRIERLLDVNSIYDINTPGMSLTVRGTALAVRVEDTGRSSLLVSESVVAASAAGEMVEVPSGFGVRAAVNDALSDVVAATTFEELDAALDGCSATLQVTGDVRLNVRVGPGLDFPRVGTVEPATVTLLVGISEAGNWYRVPFQGGLGWLSASDVTLDPNCAGLRVFPNTQIEDITAFELLGEVITEDLLRKALPAADPPTDEADE